MNNRTQKALIEFVDKVEQLAMGCVHMVGLQTVSEVAQAAENAKAAIKADETIVEVR